jgi:octaprenyl-diphosphate synthase
MGDYVFASSFYLMAKYLPKNVIGALSDTTNIICRGEISETFHRFDVRLTEEQYAEVVREKTASLFGASCQTGAMLAAADETTIEMLYRFGLGMGMAFQVIDDTLDFTGTQSKVGKPVMSDLREGKLTLPVIYCLRVCSVDEKKKIRGIIHKKIKKQSDFRDLLGLLRQYKAIEYSIQKAREYVAEAKSALYQLNGNRDKNDLLRFAEFLVNRDF